MSVSLKLYEKSTGFMFCSNQIGGWCTEGMTLDKIHSNKTSVTCLTRHLTSFAVLVSIQDERSVRTKRVLSQVVA